ncbi:hypothetical protein KM043_008512 [Ampulex compressa]|nr:hypothetical protein KM043_008512 [Ampulex compressa]
MSTSKNSNAEKKPMSKKNTKKLVQPASSYAEYDDTNVTNDVGKDLLVLMNAPVLEDSHFVFKHEKTWTVDKSHYADYFELDLKTLSAAINCIPFNEYVEIEDKYFTANQMTYIYNTVEKGKESYKQVINVLEKSTTLDIKECEKQQNVEVDNECFVKLAAEEQPSNAHKTKSLKSVETNKDMEDLDFLLSLKEPVARNPITTTSIATNHSNDTKKPPKSMSNKPVDLEKWLDSILDD